MKEKKFLYESNFYEDEDEIDLISIILIFVRRYKMIAITALFIFSLGVIFAVTRPNIYKAEMIMIVSKGENFGVNSLNEGELSVNRKLAATYTEIAKNSVILKNIIKKYNLNIGLKQLQNDVTISSVGNTELLKLTYKNSDPVLAATVTNEIGNEFILKVREIMNFQNIKVVESAEIVSEALPKKRTLIIINSFILSIVVGCMMAFITELIFYRLCKAKEIEKILEVPMIGAVPIFNFF